jgi:hypothetical protein
MQKLLRKRRIRFNKNVKRSNNTNFTTDKILQTVWVGAKYAATRDPI